MAMVVTVANEVCVEEVEVEHVEVEGIEAKHDPLLDNDLVFLDKFVQVADSSFPRSLGRLAKGEESPGVEDLANLSSGRAASGDENIGSDIGA